MSKALKFSNPIFQRGVNLTVRKGLKWAGKLGKVCLCDANNVIHEYGKIIITTTRHFNELEERDLHLEHDPKCQTIEGLAKVMREVYPDFQEDDIVTLVYFVIISKEEYNQPEKGCIFGKCQ